MIVDDILMMVGIAVALVFNEWLIGGIIFVTGFVMHRALSGLV
jgi:hypothetical protein